MHILEKKIRDANLQDRYALIPFLTAGFPDRDRFWNALHELDDNGADILEIGVPFSDPVADGPVVEDASRRALESGINLAEILKGLSDRKGQFKAGIVLMGYFNPFLQFGLKCLVSEAKNAGVHGLIIPDLPYEEMVSVKEEIGNDIALIPLVGPNTTEQRMKLYVDIGQGYVYVVSVMGVTGERANLAPQVSNTMIRARSVFKLPLALGFGLKEPKQLEVLASEAKPDAAVFGSALLKELDQGKSAKDFISRWK